TFSASQTFRISGFDKPGPAASNFRILAFGILLSFFRTLDRILRSLCNFSRFFRKEASKIVQTCTLFCASRHLEAPKPPRGARGTGKSPPKQGVRGTARSPARIGRWYKGSSRSLAALFQKGSGMAVEILSPRTIRARSIWKDLSGEKLRELARAGEKTTEYGSPVYFTRIKNRSAKNTYIVADNVTVGVMQQPIEPKKALETVRQVQDTLAEMDLIQVDRRMGENPEATLR